MIFIGEVKTRSPVGYYSKLYWKELFDIANKEADWLSIHTDYKWGGSFKLLQWAAAYSTKPVLAKGHHPTEKSIRKALDCGASYVLTVGFIPPDDLLDKCLLEPLSINQLKHYPRHAKVVWNARDLRSGEPKSETWEQARAVHDGWLCQASHIQELADIKPDADAIIVGTQLEHICKERQEMKRAHSDV